MALLRYQQALGKALRDEMARDSTVFVIGEDVRQSLRGVTKAAVAEFGIDRVLDAPISEQAFTSFATGAALAGWRPVVEYQIPALVYVAFEQIINQAQKLRLMTGGQAKIPVTYLVPGSGSRNGLAAQHSDHPYTYFVHAGVKTLVPATAYDAYGLLCAAIRDDDPVILFAPAAVLSVRDEVPDQPYLVNIGEGRIAREGVDITVVAIGHLVHDVLRLARELETEISIEVFDPRSLMPFDWALLDRSVRKTGRLVVYDDTPKSAGIAAEILATAASEMTLRVPPRRVTRADSPVPFSPVLEKVVLPDVGRLEAAIRQTVLGRVQV